MGLFEFITALLEHGRVRVGPYVPTLQADDWSAAAVTLREWDASNRQEFPGAAPELNFAVLRWAAEQFYRACQFSVYRDVAAEQVAEALAAPCPAAEPRSQHYTVDLVLRFLPELHRLARSASEGDPLCDRLRQWAEQWPLSSVGMEKVNPTLPPAVCEHAGLLQLYVDRIIARRDTSRLVDPHVRAAVRTSLGYFDELAPQLAAALKTYDVPGTVVEAQ